MIELIPYTTTRGQSNSENVGCGQSSGRPKLCLEFQQVQNINVAQLYVGWFIPVSPGEINKQLRGSDTRCWKNGTVTERG